MACINDYLNVTLFVLPDTHCLKANSVVLLESCQVQNLIAACGLFSLTTSISRCRKNCEIVVCKISRNDSKVKIEAPPFEGSA